MSCLEMAARLSAKQLLDGLDGCALVVSTDLTVVECGGTEWARFAEENGGGVEVQRERVRGAPLWHFVSGIETRDFYRKCLDVLSRGQERTVSFVYRCDSPSSRREMRMSISSIWDDQEIIGYLFHSQLLSERERPQVSLFSREVMLRAFQANQHLPLVEICSLCLKVRAQGRNDEPWREAEEYYRLGGTEQVRISHGLCPDCAIKWRGPARQPARQKRENSV